VEDEEHVIKNVTDKIAAEKRMKQLESHVEDNFLNDYFRRQGIADHGDTNSVAPSGAHTVYGGKPQISLLSDEEEYKEEGKPQFLEHPETTENDHNETEDAGEEGPGKTNIGGLDWPDVSSDN